ncbi:DUF3137 domain-containing protein [Mesomycoplasma conjunctivae]|uniref:DUF3137 domain-containing protein n=1 Tax=Mesomycoplasma conjunctivae TaxID=45361 RepID=UPI003DA2CBA1
MIKNVRDYKEKEEFKNKFEEKITPIIKNRLEDVFKLPHFKKMENYLYAILGTSILFLIVLIAGFALAFSRNGISSGIIVIFISLVFLGIAIALYYLRKKLARRIESIIYDNLNVDDLYRQGFNLLDSEIEYKNDENEENEENDEELHFPGISEDEHIVFGSELPSEAIFNRVLAKIDFVIDQKFPATLEQCEWLVRILNKKNELVREEFYYNAMIKIDIEKLEKKTEFSLKYKQSWFNSGKNLFTKKDRFGHKEMKLENKELHKKFNLFSNDELKIYEMFTPLTMELITKRVNDASNVNVGKPSFHSIGKSVYISFPSKYDFFALRTLYNNKQVAANKISEQFVENIYDVYYEISFIQIPIFLK